MDGNFDQQYERPGQRWICGHSDQGDPCPLGPSGLGVCNATADCAPIQDGDRWLCNRPQHRGGRCESGPTAEGQCCKTFSVCSPKRSMRSKRAVFVFAVVGLTFGLLLVMLGSSERDHFLSPGPLSSSHGQVLIAARHDRCGACHAEPQQTLGHWFAKATGRTPTAGPTQSELCLRCHNEARYGGSHGDPSVEEQPPRQVASTGIRLASFDANESPNSNDSPGSNLKSNLRSTPGSKLGRGRGSAHAANLACATCHREHHGKAHDLQRMTNGQCQACHQKEFASFESGHPEFSQWPQQRDARIRFDHATHHFKHFLEWTASHPGSKEMNCRACHQVTEAGEVQASVSYKQACAACHDKAWRQASLTDLDLLTLPMLDVARLEDADLDVGEWPLASDGDFDGALPPLMVLLLSADPQGARALKVLPSGDLFDVDPDNPEHLRAAADIALATKQLLFEIARSGTGVIRRRVETVAGQSRTDEQWADLLSGLPVDLVSEFQRRWFPNLVDEMPRLRSGVAQGAIAPAAFVTEGQAQVRPAVGEQQIRRPAPAPTLPASPSPGWRLDPDRLAVSYRPTGHADRCLTRWVEFAVTAPDESREKNTDGDVELGARVANRALKQLASQGACQQCHVLDRPAHGGFIWSNQQRTTRKEFSFFRHRPHLTQAQYANCLACHQVDPTTGGKQLSTRGNFYPIERQLCAGCHNAHGASNDCLTCHHYHVDPDPLRTPKGMSTERKQIGD